MFCCAVKVTSLFDFTVEDDSFTQISIGELQTGIATKLADPEERRQWAQQVGRSPGSAHAAPKSVLTRACKGFWGKNLRRSNVHVCQRAAVH